jgi:hypothetical protein
MKAFNSLSGTSHFFEGSCKLGPHAFVTEKNIVNNKYLGSKTVETEHSQGFGGAPQCENPNGLGFR